MTRRVLAACIRARVLDVQAGLCDWVAWVVTGVAYRAVVRARRWNLRAEASVAKAHRAIDEAVAVVAAAGWEATGHE